MLSTEGVIQCHLCVMALFLRSERPIAARLMIFGAGWSDNVKFVFVEKDREAM